MESTILPNIMIISIGLQFLASVVAIGLIFISGFSLPWVPISLSIFLMGVRRLVSFSDMASADRFPVSSENPELIALLISVLMFGGLLLFAPVFSRYKKKQSMNIYEKDMQIRESHHHVKNDLQLLNSIIDLQEATSSSASLKKTLKDIGLRIQSFSLLHESLYKLGGMGLSTAQYMEKLTDQVMETYGRLDIDLIRDIADIQLGADDLLHCGLIVNEALTNAYKYAFPDDWPEKRISVQMWQEAESVCLEITDTGTGVPTDVLDGSIASFGLTMINGLSGNPGWNVEILNTHGTRISVRFSHPQPVQGIDKIADVAI